MLTDVLKVLVYKLFLETFCGEMIKQLIFCQVFYIFYENGVKIFLI